LETPAMVKFLNVNF